MKTSISHFRGSHPSSDAWSDASNSVQRVTPSSATQSVSGLEGLRERSHSVSERISVRSRFAPRAALQRALFAAHWTQGQGEKLTPAERAVLQQLKTQQVAPSGSCLLMNNPNHDPDDVVAQALARQLEQLGFAQWQEWSAPVRPATPLPLGRELSPHRPDAGSGVVHHAPTLPAPRSFSGSRLTDEALHRATSDPIGISRVEHMRHLLLAADQPITLVATAGMSEVATLLKNEPQLTASKIKRIVVMAAIAAQRDGDGFVVPDRQAFPQLPEYLSAQRLFRRAQELGIPLRILSEEAARRTGPDHGASTEDTPSHPPISLSGARQASGSGVLSRDHGPLAALAPHLRQIDQPGSSLPGMSAPNPGIANHASEHSPDFDRIWGSENSLNLYQPLTLLAALDEVNSALFSPQQVAHRSRGLGTVEFIGPSQVSSPDHVRLLMSALTKLALADGFEQARLANGSPIPSSAMP